MLQTNNVITKQSCGRATAAAGAHSSDDVHFITIKSSCVCCSVWWVLLLLQGHAHGADAANSSRPPHGLKLCGRLFMA